MWHIKWKINFYIIHRIGKGRFGEKTQQAAAYFKETQNAAYFKEFENLLDEARCGGDLDFWECKKLLAKMDLLPAE